MVAHTYSTVTWEDHWSSGTGGQPGQHIIITMIINQGWGCDSLVERLTCEGPGLTPSTAKKKKGKSVV